MRRSIDPLIGATRRALFWLFRNRRTGQLTVWEWPNIPLTTYLIATGIDIVFRPHPPLGAAVVTVASIALVVWALLEIALGVNPFRRGLGTVVLTLVVFSALRQVL